MVNADELIPRAAIDRFFSKKLTGTQLLRSLAVYRGWQVPARLENMVPVYTEFDLGNNVTHFFLFSDKDAYLECKKNIGGDILGDYFVGNVSGYSAFDTIKDTVDIVNINPYSPQEIHYTREQLHRLKTWAGIVKTEMALETVHSSMRGYATLRNFDKYWFIMEDEQFVVLAPDGRGRKLAALFTAEDALDLFMERNPKPNRRAIPISGEALFKAIRKMPLEGMVFNCCGPTKPRFFPLAFAAEISDKG
ncbi:MAG: hypothetical protein WCT04_01385 [Planctomycetota bacterium]